MKTKFYAVVLIGLLSQACNVSVGSGKDKNDNSGTDTPEIRAANAKCENTPLSSNDYRYVMSENNNGKACTTGCQIYYSHQSYCSGLLNDVTNNNCARDERIRSYGKECP